MHSSISKPISLLLLILCLAMLAPFGGHAQEIGKFEGEAAAAVTIAAKTYGAQFEPPWNLNLEGRYNFSRIPMDVGLQFQYGAFSRNWPLTGITRNQHFKTFLAVTDYNFRRTKHIAPFIGFGLGVAAVKIDHSDLLAETYEHDCSACFMPRIGVEFFHHVRLTAAYRLMKSEYSSFEISLGVVIGGGRR